MPNDPKISPDAAISPSAGTPRVLIAFDPGRWKYRGVLQGINRFATQFGGWQLMILRYHDWPLPVGEMAHDADGALAGTAVEMRPFLEKLHCPQVYLSHNPQFPDHASITHDFTAVARLAFEHFQDHGLQHLAAFTTGEDYRVDAHETVAAFADCAAGTDAPPPIFVKGPRTLARGRWVLEDQIADLADWLVELPKPVGLLAIDDEHAWRALEAARLAGLAVPNDLCILGVGNDDCLCESAQPRLSSVALDYEQAGFEAARLLHALMAGGEIPIGDVDPVPPLGVVERASTDILAINDPMVLQAVTLIREQTDPPPSVADLVESLKTSRRTLYRRFTAALGRTPGEEIRRTRLEAARKLIINTDLKLVAIAVRTGFPSISQLSRDIEHAYGMRPTEMRRRVAGGRLET